MLKKNLFLKQNGHISVEVFRTEEEEQVEDMVDLFDRIRGTGHNSLL